MQWLRLPSVAAVAGRVALGVRSTATRSATAAKLSWPVSEQGNPARHLWWTCSRRSSGGASQGANSPKPKQQPSPPATPSEIEWRHMSEGRGKGSLIHKIAAFFASKSGRIGSLLLMGFLGTCLIFVQLAPHSVAQDGMCALLQSYSMGSPTPVTAHMKRIIDNAAADVTASGGISVFVSSAVEPQAWGRFGAMSGKVLLGYPVFFNATKEYDEEDLKRMVVGKRRADDANAGLISEEKLKSNEARQLGQALLLSDEAKKFAICRELIKAQLGDHRLQAGMVLMSVLVAYLTSALANRRLGLARAPQLRLLNYAAVGTLSSVLCVRALDIRRCAIEEECDRRACLLGRETALGGVEFYDKALLRQKALYALDDEKKKWFNQLGDYRQSLFRQKTLPITQRKNTCLTVFKEHFEATTQQAKTSL